MACGHLLSGLPHELFVLNSVSVVHATLHVSWEMLLRPSGFIVSVKAERELFKPIEHLSNVILTSLLWHGVFYNCEAITKEVLVPLSCRLLVLGVRHAV